MCVCVRVRVRVRVCVCVMGVWSRLEMTVFIGGRSSWHLGTGGEI